MKTIRTSRFLAESKSATTSDRKFWTIDIDPIATLVGLDHHSPVNVFHNPAAITIMNPSEANERSCAIIRLTDPAKTVQELASDDRNIRWDHAPTSVGKVGFLQGKDYGASVFVYGISPGEVVLRSDYNGISRPALFRSIVVPLRRIRTRITLYWNDSLKERSDVPKWMPDADHFVRTARQHVIAANIHLRQIGLELVPDDSLVQALDGSEQAGSAETDAMISRVERVASGVFIAHVRDLSLAAPAHGDPNEVLAVQANARNETFNIAYVALEGNLGGTTRYPNCPLNWGSTTRDVNKYQSADVLSKRFIADSGTPSSSWIAPSGLTPRTSGHDPLDLDHGAANLRPAITQRLTIAPAFPEYWTLTANTRHPNLQWGLLISITDIVGPAPIPQGVTANGAPMSTDSQSIQIVGETIAHEFGHLLGLFHRGISPGKEHPDFDGLAWPIERNIMHPDIYHPWKSQNFDILQVKATRQSEILFRDNALSVAASDFATDLELDTRRSHAARPFWGALIGAAACGLAGGLIVGLLVGTGVIKGQNPAAVILAGTAIGAVGGAAAGALIGGLALG